MEKLPPAAKVYEAYSAIADQRVVIDEQEAYVTSSDHAKRYTVRFKENIYSSNDNASVWQHYAGYPILAVLMLQNYLPLHEELLPHFAHVNWKALNTKYHNHYDQAIQAFYEEHPDLDQQQVECAVEECLKACETLDIIVKGNRAKR